jgi:hypothetical protein
MTCPLADVCVAKASEFHGKPSRIGIAAEATGLLRIDDAIKFRRQWSQQQWEAEAECARPSLTGLVYPQFDRRLHIKPGLDFADELPTYRTIDWGLNNFVCLWIQEGKSGEAYIVDEYWAENTTLADHARYIREKDELTKIAATFCDPAGRNRSDQTGYSDIDVFKSHGIPCRYTLNPWAREVRNGINEIRAMLRPGYGKPRVYIAGACKKTIEAFEAYSLRKVNGEYVDEPVKPQPFDHPMDAFRYYVVNRSRKTQSGSAQLGATG